MICSGPPTFIIFRNLAKALRILSALPCTIVLLLAPPDFSQFDRIPNKSIYCVANLRFSCNCLYQGDVAANSKRFKYLSQSLESGMNRIAKQFTKSNFGVEVVQAWKGLPPKNYRGVPLRQSVVHDCFHFTAQTQGQLGINLYNNLVEPANARTSNYGKSLRIKCPSSENPFISTRGNSGYGKGLQRNDNDTDIALDEVFDNFLTNRDE